MNKVTVDWVPNKSLKTPMYQQIVDYIFKKISNGDWAIGFYLPSERKLAEDFKVNRSTISEALDILKGYGILDGEGGKGTVIISNTWSLMFSTNRTNWGSLVKSGNFKENLPTIQEINKMEFDNDIIRLGTGELAPELYPQQMLKKIFERLPFSIASLNYLEPLGLLELREALAERLNQKGIKCTPTNILITSGSLQALQLISLSLLNEDSVVFTEAPSYLQSVQVFQSSGITLEGISMDQEGLQYWKIKDRIKFQENSALYTIPNFHNPTGIIMSEARRRELIRFCTENMLPIIEDDAYGELWFDEAPAMSLKSSDEHGMILYLGTISKTLAPGLRIGWLVGSESIVNRLGDVKMQIDYGASSVSQWILKEMLTEQIYDNYLQDLRTQLKRRRNLMLSYLDKYFSEIANWTVPKGGFYIWLQFKDVIAMDKLFQMALKEGILINPGSIYDYKKNHSLRLSYSYVNEDVMEESLLKLSLIIKSLNE